jgi:hypothetical protein
MTSLKAFSIFYLPFTISHFWKTAEFFSADELPTKMENEQWQMASGKCICSFDAKRELE